VTQIAVSGEELVLVAAPAGGVAGIDFANNLTYIDVQILPNRGGRK